MTYNLFVDESCHLEHDGIPVMGIAYIKVPHRAYHELREMFKSLQQDFHAYEELKWNKFSKSRVPFYKNLIDFFFENPIEFRAIVVKYKERLNHQDFNQGSHDNFYYKMIYFMLKPNPVGVEYRVFLDLKDTRGRDKLSKIQEVFRNVHAKESPYVHFQHIRSHHNLFIQLADFFVGAITYKSRVVKGALKPEVTRMEIIKYLEERSGYLLHEGTPAWESKFNIFDHQPKSMSGAATRA